MNIHLLINQLTRISKPRESTLYLNSYLTLPYLTLRMRDVFPMAHLQLGLPVLGKQVFHEAIYSSAQVGPLLGAPQ